MREKLTIKIFQGDPKNKIEATIFLALLKML
jgi:hypothetical protein